MLSKQRAGIIATCRIEAEHISEEKDYMKNEKWVCAVGTTLALAAITLQASSPASVIARPTLVTSAQMGEKSRWLENHYFNLGTRDGYRDHKGKKHSNRRDVFPNENAKAAYDAGYEKGRQGKRSYRLEHPLSVWGIVRAPSEEAQ